MKYIPRQCITTHYIAPTNTKPARLAATSAGGARIITPYLYSNEGSEHGRAATLLCVKLGWNPDNFVGTRLPKGGMVWVDAKGE